MQVKCKIICQVTELFNKSKRNSFEIELYNVHSYVDHPDFKVEYKMQIVRVISADEEGEVLKEKDWFTKTGKETYHHLNFATAHFVYNEKTDSIHLDRDFDTV